MKVVLLIDTFDISQEDCPIVNRLDQVSQIRKKIRDHLSNSQNGTIKIKTNEDLYKRFHDLEGTLGLEVRRILPSSHLIKTINEQLPVWLNEKIIFDFNLFNKKNLPENFNEERVFKKILYLINPQLLSFSNINEFYKIVSVLPESFLTILRANDIYNFFLDRLTMNENSFVADTLLSTIKQSDSVIETLNKIGEEQALECARNFVEKNNILNISFSPRLYSKSLLSDMSTIHIFEKNAETALPKILEILKNCDALIRNKQLSPHVIADIVVPWPSFLNELSLLIDEYPALVTSQLQEKLINVDSPGIKDLCRKVEAILQIGVCEPLNSTSTIDEALIWSKNYLNHTQNCFLNNSEPDNKVSDSFTKWFLNERVKIQRSSSDWCFISNAVEESLKKGNIVVLCIIDALSALHIDAIKNKIETSIEGAVVDDKLIFSPIPTLTETCKLAVATGRPTFSLSNKNQNSILIEHYGQFINGEHSIQIAQSWKEFRTSLDEKTKLLICIENRIDERLHKCSDFNHHKKDVELIVKSLIKDIDDWIIRAAQLRQKIEIIITADHGVTYIKNKQDISKIDTTSVSDRVCVMTNSPEILPESTFYINKDGSKGGYLTPLSRVKFLNKSNLVHGGLTAEEILIPFIKVTKKPRIDSQQQLLKLSVVDQQCQVANTGWYVKLSIQTYSTNIKKLIISTKEPFTGREGPIGPLSANKITNISFNLISDVEQFGLVHVPFRIKYSGENESDSRILDISLTLNLYERLIEKNNAAKAFDNMFD